MKALVYTDVETLSYRDVPIPVPDSGEVLVKIAASGICGSDMHAYRGHDERRPAPVILGHEAAGVIEGSEHAGKRVTINPLVTCGSCPACKSGRSNLCPKREIISMQPRQGAFAEYVSMPMENLVFVPDHISFDKAVLAEPLACGWHAVRLGRDALDKPLENSRCMVIGGGAIGVGVAASLAAFGAEDITVLEPNALRRERLSDIDGFQVRDPAATGDQTNNSVDLVVDAVGIAASRANACLLVRPGGVIVHIGLGDNNGGLDIRRMTLQEITFIGTYTYTASDFVDTAQAIFDGRLGTLDWTEKRPMDQGQQAFSDLLAGRVDVPKVVLVPDR